MEDKRLPRSQSVSDGQTPDSLDYADGSTPVSGFSSAQKTYPIESLEVHHEGDAPAQKTKVFSPTLRSVPFSRRRAALISLGITLSVVLLTGVALAYVVRQNTVSDSAVERNVPTQDVGINEPLQEDDSISFQGEESSLLVNGDIITRGELKVVSGNFLSVIKAGNLTENREFSFPDESGTLCLDTNNCDYAEAADVATLQTQLGQIVIPEAFDGVDSLNGQNGSVTIQGSLNRINVTTANGVITLSTPQALDANANVQFASLTLGAGGQIISNGLSFVDNGRTFSFPAGGLAAQEICTDQGNCGAGGGSVTSLNSMTGAITLQGTTDQINIVSGAGLITLSTPQDIAVTSSPTFGGLDVDGRVAIGSSASISTTAALKVDHTSSVDCSFACSGIDVTNRRTASSNLVIGVDTGIRMDAVGAISAAGLNIRSNTTVNGGSIGANYGIRVSDQTAGSNDYGIYIQGADTYALWVDADLARFDGGIEVQGANAIIFEGSTEDANEFTLAVEDPTVDVTYQFVNPSGGAGTYDICTTDGNCAGVGGGITGSGTLNTIAKFTSSGTVGDSLLTDDGSTVSVGGNLSIGANTLQGTTAAIDFTNFDVSSAGAVTAVGVDAGAGLLQGTGGVTLTGAANINATGTSSTIIGNTGGASAVTIRSGTGGTQFLGNITTINTTQIELDALIITLDAASIQALSGDITLGEASTTNGSLTLHNSTNSNTITLQSGVTSASYALTLPTAVGSANQCLKDSDGAGTLFWDDCDGGSGGSSATLQSAYNAGNSITTTDSRDVAFTLANTTTDANFLVDLATGSSGRFAVQGNGTDILGVDSTSVTIDQALTVNADTTLGGDMRFAVSGTTHVIDVGTPSSSSGDDLQIKAGDGGAIGDRAGGDLLLNGGNGTGTEFGGSVILQGGATSTGTPGAVIVLQSTSGGNDPFFVANSQLAANVFDIAHNGNYATVSLAKDCTNCGSELQFYGRNALQWSFEVEGGSLGSDDFGIYQDGTTQVFGLSNSDGSAIFRNSADSTTAFQVQNAAGTTTALNVDTTNSRIGIGTTDTSSSVITIAVDGTYAELYGVGGDFELAADDSVDIIMDADVSGAGETFSVYANQSELVWSVNDSAQMVVGNTSNDGAISLSDGNGQYAHIEVGDLAADRILTIPVATSDDTFCLATLGNCFGSGSGATLQAAYDAGNTITTTDSRDISFTLADTTTDSNFLVDIATGSTGRFAVQGNGTDVLGVTSSAVTLSQALTVNANATVNGILSSPDVGSDSERFGSGSSASGTGAVAIGFSSSAGNNGAALGWTATAGSNSTAIGHNAQASSGSAVAIGSGSSGGNSSVAIGNGATSGSSTVSIGQGAANSTRTNSVAIGQGATLGANSSIAIGLGAATTSSSQMVIGSDTVPISQVYIGDGVTSATPNSFTLQASGGSGTDIAGADFTLAGGKGTGSSTGGSILFQTSDAGASGSTLQGLSTKVTLLANGNLGVGDTTPAALFTVGTGDALQVDASGNLTTTGEVTVDTIIDLTDFDMVSNGSFYLMMDDNADSGTNFFNIYRNGSYAAGDLLYTMNESGDITTLTQSVTFLRGFLNLGVHELSRSDGQSIVPLSSFIELTCTTGTGCTLTLDEISSSRGQTVRIINVGTNTVTIADSSGSAELSGDWSAAGQWDSIDLIFAEADGTSGRWVELSRSDN